MRYDFTDLKLFLTLSKTLNLSQAADLVGLTTSAVSLRLKKLEDALNTQLFVREPRGVRLTPAGLALKPYAEKVLNDVYALDASIKNFQPDLQLELRIASNSTGLQIFLADVIGSFLSTHCVRCKFFEMSSPEVVRHVLEGKVDLGFGIEQSLPAYQDTLKTLPYVHDRHVLITPKNHPLSHLSITDYASALMFPQITLLESNPITQAMKKRTLKIGHQWQPVLQVVSFELVHKLVASSAGVAVVPYSSFKTEEAKKGLRIIELTDAWADRPLAFFTTNIRWEKPEVSAFINHAFSLKEA